MQQPQLYKLLIGSYQDLQLPSLDRLERELYTEEKYGILRDAANTAAQVFLDSANYAGIIDANNFLRLPSVNDVRELVEADKCLSRQFPIYTKQGAKWTDRS